MCRHGIPLSIISDRGAQFTSRFWRSFQKGLGTIVMLNITFHHQTDGQAERTIQTLEDMLGRALLISREIATSISLGWSLLIIMVFINPSPWLHTKPYMVGGVGLLLDGSKWVSLRFLVLSRFKRLWKSFIS